MTFEEKIQAVINSMSIPPTFIGGDWFQANRAVESIQMPIAFYINPISGTLEFITQALDTPSCLIAFMDKCIIDPNFDNTTKCINDMKALAVEFVARLNKSEHFFPIKNVRYEVSYDRLDANLCGVIIQAEIKERAGVNLCKLVENVPVVTLRSYITAYVVVDNDSENEEYFDIALTGNEYLQPGQVSMTEPCLFNLLPDTYAASILLPEGYSLVSVSTSPFVIPTQYESFTFTLHKD